METNTEKQTKERMLVDGRGREIPAKVIDRDIIKRDAVVRKVVERAIRMHEKLEAEKHRITQELEDYLSELAKANNLEWKGNAILFSFDESQKVEVRYKENIRFGVELQLAKQKIDECLKEWTSDSNVNLRAIINEAFQVDKKGEIAKYRILALRRYNIKDPTWKEAMELIDKAIQVTSTKQYVAFYQKDKDKSYEQIILNFSAI